MTYTEYVTRRDAHWDALAQELYGVTSWEALSIFQLETLVATLDDRS